MGSVYYLRYQLLIALYWSIYIYIFLYVSQEPLSAEYSGVLYRVWIGKIMFGEAQLMNGQQQLGVLLEWEIAPIRKWCVCVMIAIDDRSNPTELKYAFTSYPICSMYGIFMLIFKTTTLAVK